MATQSLTRTAAGRIRDALTARHLTHEWLSEKTGIPMRTLARRLHLVNPSSLTLEELAVIADALGTDIADLLESSPARAAA